MIVCIGNCVLVEKGIAYGKIYCLISKSYSVSVANITKGGILNSELFVRTYIIEINSV